MSKPSSKHQVSKRDFGKIGILKPTAQQITHDLLILTIKNSISFNKIDNPSFHDFLKNHTSNSFIPDCEDLNYYCIQLYNTFQDYFINYFKIHVNYQCSITFHKWVVPDEIEPYIFIDAHYVNDQGKICSIPLGFFQYNDDDLINFMINNSIFKNLSIQSLTTDFYLNEKCLQTFKCFLNENDDVYEKIMFSLPHFLLGVLDDFLSQFAGKLEFNYTSNSIHNSNCLIDHVSIMIQSFLGPVYTKFLNLPLDEMVAHGETHEGNLSRIHQIQFKNQKCFTMEYLSTVIYYKNQLVDDNFISNSDWELIEFLLIIIPHFVEPIKLANDGKPTSHMILKWVKVLIFHMTNLSIHQAIGTFRIDDIMKNLVQQLKDYHDLLETKFDLILSTYLHPTTKRFLKNNQISSINRFIESQNQNSGAANSLDVDDIIAKMFDCSGQNSMECYHYETSSNNATYPNDDSYLGSMDFWKSNNLKFPTLAQYANQSFSIQASTNKSISDFKSNLYNWKQTPFNYQPLCDIQAIYFLYNLSNNYDILNFDPKNLDEDIEDYILPYVVRSAQSLSPILAPVKRKRVATE